MRARRFWALLAVAALTAAFGPQEDPSAPQEKIEIEFSRIRTWTEADGRKGNLLIGDVRVRTSDMSLRADSAIAWANAQTGEIEELYAEGEVLYRRGNEEIRADRLHFDMTKRLATMSGLQLRGMNPTTLQPFVARARIAREVKPGLFVAEDLAITTCDHAKPHYELRVRTGELRGLDPRVAEGQPTPGFPYPYRQFQATGRDITLRFFGIPIFYLPYASFSSGGESYLRQAAFGRSKRFGYFLLTEWGIELRRGRLDPAHADKKLGTLSVILDYRQRRGWATGVNLKYELDSDLGYLRTYGLDDRGQNPRVDFDRQFVGQTPRRRARARFFHRHEFDEHWRGEVEVNKIGDRHLLQEFFPKELYTDKAPESAAYLRWLDGPVGAYALARPRINSWQNQVEFLPRLGVFDLSRPFLLGPTGPIYLSVSSEVGNFQQRFDHRLVRQSGFRDFRTLRWDTYAELATSVDAHPVEIRPFVGARATAYENDAAGRARVRTIFQGGVSLQTTLQRVYAVGSRALGIDHLRHVSLFGASASSNFHANGSRTDLLRMDPVDALGRFSEVAFQTEQRFETLTGPARTPYEFLTVRAGIEYYPSPGRDTTLLAEDSSSYPFYWITVPPTPNGTFERRAWSNVHWDLAFRPLSYVSVTFAQEWDPRVPREEVRQFGLTVHPIPELTLFMGNTWVRGVTNAYTFGGELRVAPRWRLWTSVSYDQFLRQFIRQTFILERDIHDFILNVSVEHDFIRGENRFLFGITPKFIPGAVAESRQWDARGATGGTR